MKKRIFSIIIAAVMMTALWAAAGTASAAGRNLSHGLSGDDVFRLQSLLADHGYFLEEPTGYFGEITLQALLDFQSDAGLEVDGIAGPITQGYLGLDTDDDEDTTASSQTRTVSANTTSGNPFSRVLSIGSSGADVTALQQLLAVLGYFDEVPTGYFGPITEDAVIMFQAEYGLDTDGVVGPITAGQLTGTVPSGPAGGNVVEDASDYASRVLDAIDRTPAAGSGYCASWVTQVMTNAGILTYDINNLKPQNASYAVVEGLTDEWYSDSTGFNANDYWAYVCSSSNLDDLEVGMVVATRNSFTYLGKQFGHVGIYIGDGEVISSVGYLEVLSLDEFISRYNNEEMGSTVAWGYVPE